MKTERQNKQNFTVKPKINCRKREANSLIDLRDDDIISIDLDIVQGSGRSCSNDSTYFQTTLASIGACREEKILYRIPPFGLEKGPEEAETDEVEDQIPEDGARTSDLMNCFTRIAIRCCKCKNNIAE